MGAYCLRASIPSHAARKGEIMEVLWSDYYGAVLFGDRGEIACIPHKGCRLEVVATAMTSHRGVNLLLPGQVIQYWRSFFLGDRFKLPNGARVGLDELVGFKLQLGPETASVPPVEELIVERARRTRARVSEDDAPGHVSAVPSHSHDGAFSRFFAWGRRR